MKNWSKCTYVQRIQWRIRGLWCLSAAIVGYIFVISALGGGDSRIVSRLADMVGDIVLFGGLVWTGWRIRYNKKMLANRALLQAQQQQEQDERNRWLHDKSGGTVLDVLLAVLLFVTVTAAQFSMAAFYAVFAVLLAALALKAGAYSFYSKRG